MRTLNKQCGAALVAAKVRRWRIARNLSAPTRHSWTRRAEILWTQPCLYHTPEYDFS